MKSKKLIWMLSLIVIASACKKFIQIPPPTTQLVTSTVFNNATTANAALTNIYQQMYTNSESFSIAQSTGFVGDELINYSSSVYYIQLFSNSMTGTPNTFGPWNTAYNYIYQANAIIKGLQASHSINARVTRQLTGESKFIRAFWLFNLVNFYGDIPVPTSSSYTLNASLPRTPKTQVYAQIISDLKDAENLLNPDFVDATDTATTSERVRPTKYAAIALLAKVYLYNGDLTGDMSNYTNAETAATNVIDRSSVFILSNDLNSVFLANSTEAIWQLAPTLPNSYNTSDGFNFILQGAPGDASGQLQSLSPQLLSAFEAGDKRKDDWTGVYTTTDAPIINYYYPYKYKIYNNQAITEYTMVLRLAEQYLIRAEARAKLGENTVVGDLNTIRNRAGLANYTGLTDKQSLLAAIFQERQVELFTEWGNRWFDMNRTGNVNKIMGSPGNVCHFKGGTWNTDWALFPIPQSEILIDRNLKQNQGY